jgi:hypothetical protein
MEKEAQIESKESRIKEILKVELKLIKLKVRKEEKINKAKCWLFGKLILLINKIDKP